MDIRSITSTAAYSPNLTYFGGKVLKHPEFSSIYYGSFWNTDGGSKERAVLDKFSKYFVRSRHTKIWAEFSAGKGIFRGSSVFKSIGEKRVVTESDLQGIVASSIDQKLVKNPGSESVYTVFLAPNVVLVASDGMRSTEGMGGYHGSFLNKSGQRVYYAAIVYSTKGNGIDFTETSRDNITITASHEWTETVTDPDVGEDTLGWYNYRYGEVSDIPMALLPIEQTFGRRNGYAVQKEWSNASGKIILP